MGSRQEKLAAVLRSSHFAIMKRGTKWWVAMALLSIALIIVCVPAHFGVGDCTFTTCSGLLNGTDFLDGSTSVFQSISWHMADATKCWGDTYGLKIGKLFWSLSVMHGRPEEADP
jgi:hypothetical protein